MNEEGTDEHCLEPPVDQSLMNVVGPEQGNEWRPTYQASK